MRKMARSRALRLRSAPLSIAVLAAPISPGCAQVVFDGVAAGDPSATDAILWTRAENGGNTTDLKAQIATDPSFADIVSTLAGTTSAAGDFTLKLDATGLHSNMRYYYRFLAQDGRFSSTGQFTTAPLPNEKVEIRFGFSGDADGRFRPYPSLGAIGSQKLSLFCLPRRYDVRDGGRRFARRAGRDR